MMRRTICAIMMAMATAGVSAQSGTNSPYSQYGLGVLADQSQGFNRGMNGVGIGLRNGSQVNTLNPASYSGVDSLTMLFDAGFSGQITNFKEGSTRLNAKNANFDYVVGSFRAFRNIGIGFGVLPFSNVGYAYSATSYQDQTNGTITETYEGDGGVHQAFLGVGVRVLKPLSVGVNFAYLWGGYDKTVTSSSTTYINSLVKQYSADVSNYKLDLGVQWEQALTNKDVLTVGATIGVGHNLKADPECMIINVNSTTSSRDTTTFRLSDGLELPMMYGIGASLRHDKKLVVAADFQLQKWGSSSFPDFSHDAYVLRSGVLKDCYRANLGAEWIPGGELSHKFFNRVRYRVGAGLATPYYKINGQDGPKELSVSAGFGIPVINRWNNRSLLNISAQWTHRSADNLITENTFRINIGLTFNERWFAKWRVE